jgi:hypothetical protein
MDFLDSFSLLVGLIFMFGTASLFNLSFPVRGIVGNWLAIWCLSLAQVVLLSEILSELHLIGRTGFLVGHLLLFLAALTVWLRRGRPIIKENYWFSRSEIIQGVQQHPVLGILGLILAVLATVNLIVPFYLPSFNGDALSYHLPRAYFWWQHETAHHFYTGDFRQVEFPPNTSFYFMWIMALSNGYRWLHVPQWLSGLVAALSACGLARIARHDRPQSIFSGLIYLTFPMVVLQLSTSQNDLITTAAAAPCLFFALRIFVSAEEDRTWTREAVYAGLAFGLALGSKYTVFFLLPGFILGIIIVGLYDHQRIFTKRSPVLIAALMFGFLLFGSYNYILNCFDFHHPLYSQEAKKLVSNRNDPHIRSFKGNLARYIYQSLDWNGIVESQDHLLVRSQLEITRTISNALNLNIEAPAYFDIVRNPFGFPSEDRAGLGIIGFLVILVSLFMGVFFLLRYSVNRNPKYLLTTIFIMIGWSWLLLFSGLVDWTPNKTRYFVLFMPLLSAAVLPWIYDNRWWSMLWLIPLLMLSVWTCYWFTANGHYRSVPGLVKRAYAGARPLELMWGGRLSQQIPLLGRNFPAGSKIGMSMKMDSMMFHLIREFPEYTFITLRPDEISDRLSTGHVAAVVVEPLEVFKERALPMIGFQDQGLYVSDPSSFLWKNRDLYGFNGVRDGHVNALVIRSLYTFTDLVKIRWKTNPISIKVPTVGLPELQEKLLLVVPYSGRLQERGIVEAIWNGRSIEYRIFRRAIALKVLQDDIYPEFFFQTCSIKLAPGLRARIWDNNGYGDRHLGIEIKQPILGIKISDRVFPKTELEFEDIILNTKVSLDTIPNS